MGRPTKRVPRTLARLEEALTKGLPRWAACAYAKISNQAFYEWMKDPTFAQQIAEWEATALSRLVGKVAKEPQGNRFLLAHRFRADYGDRVEIEHTGGVQVYYTNDWRKASDVALPSSGPANSTIPGVEVQLVSGGPAVEEDDPVPVDSD